MGMLIYLPIVLPYEHMNASKLRSYTLKITTVKAI